MATFNSKLLKSPFRSQENPRFFRKSTLLHRKIMEPSAMFREMSPFLHGKRCGAVAQRPTPGWPGSPGSPSAAPGWRNSADPNLPPLESSEISRGFTWDFHGIFLGFPGVLPGISRGFTWDFHGIYLFLSIQMGFTWDFHCNLQFDLQNGHGK